MITGSPHAETPQIMWPRAVIVVNNIFVMPATEANVTQNDFTQADTFEVYSTFSIENTSSDEWLANTLQQASEFLNQDVVDVWVYLGYASSPEDYDTNGKMMKRVMYGRLDTFEITGDSTGITAHLVGRNLVGPMQDTQVNYSGVYGGVQLRNMTGSQLAAQLASDYGLQTMITPTTTKLGTYFAQENIDLKSNTNQWDLLTQSAAFDQFIARIWDDTLYYGPSSLVAALIGSTPTVHTWGWDIQEFDLTRSPSGVTDIKVTVKSYNVEYKQNIEGVAESHATKNSTNTGSYEETLIWPGLTQAQAQNKAQDLLDQISQRQIQGYITVLGDPFAQVDGRTQCYGFGAGLDVEYYNSKIEHKFNIPQLGEGATSGNDSTDGYLTTKYLSNSLLMNTTQASNALGLGVPLVPSPKPAADIINLHGANTAGGVTYPPPGFRGMDYNTQVKVSNWLQTAFQLTGVQATVWFPGMMWLVEQESTGSPTAVDQQSVEYSPGVYEHAEGLCQMMPSTFKAYALSGYNTNIFDPVSNAVAAVKYIQANFGTVNKIQNIGTGSYTGY